MFIIRLGVEALKNSDISLSHDCCSNEFKHSILGKLKCRRQFELKKTILKRKSTNRPKQKGILYNLLKQSTIKTDSLVLPNKYSFSDRPNSLNSATLTSKSDESSCFRPSSAPHIFKYHSYPSQKSLPELDPVISELTAISGEKLMIKWLRKMVLLSKYSQSNERCSFFTKFDYLNDSEKLTVLKQNWHLLFTTYLAEFIQNSHEDVRMIMSLLIKDYNRTVGNSNYKKNFRITRMLTDYLETIISQIINLNMSSSLYKLFRITIVGIVSENNEDEKIRRIELFKSWHSHPLDDYRKLIDQLMEDLSKLDISMMESTFYGHLSRSIDSIIDEMFSES